MKTIVEALKAFYQKIGGQSFGDCQTISEAIDKITAQTPQGGGGGGAGLPEVTAADNGDVLTVVEGAWAKASPSGALVIGINVDEQTEIQSLNKTWQEIYDAMANGKGAIIVNETSNYASLAIEVYADDSTTPPQYQVVCLNEATWTAESADGYPIEAS